MVRMEWRRDRPHPISCSVSQHPEAAGVEACRGARVCKLSLRAELLGVGSRLQQRPWAELRVGWGRLPQRPWAELEGGRLPQRPGAEVSGVGCSRLPQSSSQMGAGPR